MITFLTVVYVLVCVFLILVVLLQAGRGGGMGSAFGGASQTVFGASGGANFMTRLTVVMAALFMLLSATLAYLSSSSEKALERAGEAVRLREQARDVSKAPAPAKQGPASGVPEEGVGTEGAPPVQFVGADGKPIEGIQIERVEGADLENFKASGAKPLWGDAPSPAAPAAPAAGY